MLSEIFVHFMGVKGRCREMQVLSEEEARELLVASPTSLVFQGSSGLSPPCLALYLFRTG